LSWFDRAALVNVLNEIVFGIVVFEEAQEITISEDVGDDRGEVIILEQLFPFAVIRLVPNHIEPIGEFCDQNAIISFALVHQTAVGVVGTVPAVLSVAIVRRSEAVDEAFRAFIINQLRENRRDLYLEKLVQSLD